MQNNSKKIVRVEMCFGVNYYFIIKMCFGVNYYFIIKIPG